MISPSYSLTATERVLPVMALDFTTALLDSRVTLTRSGNTATVTNSSGVIVAINADLPRFDFDPTTLVCKGLLIEEARTNVLLNSLIDGTDLATQIVTVTASARTFSFYGSGTVVLSGAHSATVVGAGAYPARTSLTFTPSAGVLTLTVTGTVQFAQLEAGALPTSYIPTAATAVTRNADQASMTGTNFSDWYNPTEGTFVVQSSILQYVALTAPAIFAVSNGTVNNRIQQFYGGTNTVSNRIVASGAAANPANNTTDISNIGTTALAYKVSSAAACADGNAVTTSAPANIPVVNTLFIGADFRGLSPLNGHVQRLSFYKQRLINAETQSTTN